MRVFHAVFILTILCLSTIVNVFAQTPFQTITEPTATQKAVSLNEPAVVLIYAEYTATYTYPHASYTVDDQGQFHFTAHPEKGVYTDNVDEGSFGSGFVITPDGYIMTNAHVGTSQLSKDEYVDSVALAVTEAQLKDGSIRQDQEDNFVTAYLQFLKANGQFGNEQNIVDILVGVVQLGGPIKNLLVNGIVADMKVAGDYRAKDVALLKVSVDFTLPTVELGDSSTVTPGDPVVVIGYPGITSEAQNIAGMESIEPTATAGIASALKTTQTSQGQFQLIQTDASIHHGNSGGPALNAQGQVIGIASLAAGNPNAPGEELSNVGFLLPINVADEYASQINVKNSRGPIDAYWAQGLDYYWGHHYSAAIEQFQKVQALYPGHPYADRYIKLSQAEISKGNDVPLPLQLGGLSIDPMTLVGAVAVLAVAIVAVFVYTRHRKKVAQRVRPIFSPPPPPPPTNRLPTAPDPGKL